MLVKLTSLLVRNAWIIYEYFTEGEVINYSKTLGIYYYKVFLGLMDTFHEFALIAMHDCLYGFIRALVQKTCIRNDTQTHDLFTLQYYSARNIMLFMLTQVLRKTHWAFFVPQTSAADLELIVLPLAVFRVNYCSLYLKLYSFQVVTIF